MVARSRRREYILSSSGFSRRMRKSSAKSSSSSYIPGFQIGSTLGHARRERARNRLGRPLVPMIKRTRIYRRRPDAILFLRFHPATAWLKANTLCSGIRIQDCNQLIFQLVTFDNTYIRSDL